MAANNCDNFTNPISVNTGGTSLTTLTSHSIQIGNGTSAPTQLAVGASSTILTGVTSLDPAFSATPVVTSITFGAGTAMSNYTEGTWTPTLDGAVSGTTTYAAQTGYYTRIGNEVIALLRISITGATGTGNAIIGGLPFTIRSRTNGDFTAPIEFTNASGLWTWPVGRTKLVARGLNNTTTMLIVGIGSAVSASNLQMFNTSLIINVTFNYTV